MNDHKFHRRESSRKTAGLWPQLLIGAIGIGMVFADLPGQASESQIPWECSSYTGDAHTRCVEAFAESQQDQIATLQEKAASPTRDRQSLKRSARPSDIHERRAATPAGTTTRRRASSPSPLRLPSCGIRPLLRVAPGSTGRRFSPSRTSTGHTSMDYATEATVGNEVFLRPVRFLAFSRLRKTIVSRRMLKKAVQQGRRRVETRGVPFLTRPSPSCQDSSFPSGVR